MDSRTGIELPPQGIFGMTWSIVAFDRQTRALGVAAASHLPVAVVPSVIPGLGAVASQGQYNPQLGMAALQLMSRGAAPHDIVASLVGDDAGHVARQLHIVDLTGRNAGYTGSQCQGWAGQIIDHDVSVAGNVLAGADVISAALKAYKDAARAGHALAYRLLAGLAAGEEYGGDKRGTRSAALVVAGVHDAPLEIHVDDVPNPIAEIWNRIRQSPLAHRSDSRASILAQSILGNPGAENGSREEARQGLAFHPHSAPPSRAGNKSIRY